VPRPLALDQPVLRQLLRCELARDVGRSEAAELGELAHVALAGAQQVEDLQARRLGQDLEIGCYLLERLGGSPSIRGQTEVSEPGSCRNASFIERKRNSYLTD
jgi:hypothetical protein